MPPFNARFSKAPAERVHNVWPTHSTPAVAQVTGFVEWRCPACQHSNKARTGPLGDLYCANDGCDDVRYVSVIITPTVHGRKRRTPLDWIP